MSRTFASLGYHNYRIWFFGSLCAATGVWMQRVAQDWVVFTEMTHHDANAVGIISALQFAPQMFLSPYAGVVADRMNRRRLIQVTQGLMLLTSIVMAVLLATGSAQLWHFYALAAVGGCVQTFDNPARQIFVNELVPSCAVPNAVGLNSASFNLARMLGPAVAGAALAAWGLWVVFAANAVLLAGPIVALAVMDASRLYESSRAARARGQVREGVRYLRGRTDLMVIVVVASVVSCLGMNFQLYSTVMAVSVFNRGAGQYGLLSSIMAIGSLTGALVAARRTRPRVRGVVLAAFVFGIFELGMAASPSYWVYAVLSVPWGFFALTMITSANATIQVTTEPRFRGRVMALYTMLFLGSTPVGSLLAGYVAQAWGPRWPLIIGGVASVLVSALAALWVRSHWDMDVRMHIHRPFVEVVGPSERLER